MTKFIPYKKNNKRPNISSIYSESPLETKTIKY